MRSAKLRRQIAGAPKLAHTETCGQASVIIPNRFVSFESANYLDKHRPWFVVGIPNGDAPAK
jgi:hypothetical protein